MYVKSHGEDKEPRFVVRFTPRCIALVYRRNAVKRIIEVVDNRTVRILNPDEPVVFIVDIGGERGISNLGAYRSSPLIVGEIVRRAAAGYAVYPAVGIIAIRSRLIILFRRFSYLPD